MEELTGPALFELIMSKMEDTDVQKKVIKLLARFDGKKPSKWMAKALEKEFPGYSVDFSCDRRGWSPSSLKVGRVSFTLGFRESEFNYEAFKEKYEAEIAEADKRNEERNQYVMDNKCIALVEAVEAANRLTAELSKLLEECPVKYEVKRHVLNA